MVFPRDEKTECKRSFMTRWQDSISIKPALWSVVCDGPSQSTCIESLTGSRTISKYIH